AKALRGREIWGYREVDYWQAWGIGQPSWCKLNLEAILAGAEARPASRGPALVTHFAGPGTVNVTVCPVKMWCSGSASSISTLCWPGGSPTTTIVLLSPKSPQCHGRSSTVTCRCPTRGETLAAGPPSTGRTRKFSTRYGIRTAPRASGPGSGASTASLGADSFSTATNGEGSRTAFAVWAKAIVASAVPATIAGSVLMSLVMLSLLALVAG